MTTSDTTPPDSTAAEDHRDSPDARATGSGRGALPWRRILGALAAAAVLAGCAPFAWSLASTADDRHTAATVPDRPVALVLGAGVRPDGIPTLLLARRLDTAADLYFDGRVRAILVSGDNSVDHYNEPDTMREYLIGAGVPENRVVADYAGFSTWDSCARAREVFGVEEATVVTQDFHLPRAVGLCRTAGIDAVGVADSSLRERTTATVYGWIREVPATAAAFLTSVFRPDPVFLGEYESGVDDALAASEADDQG
ncbi:vancomycin high temperature exclusion protein [Nocardiopsis sp. NPDC050513]|uniref:vancomycin high temperature exclusion protein n=1 Tax=Nocardiopsis sp. NPDC050513 TaxID=3364338 RepID=UPI003791B894